MRAVGAISARRCFSTQSLAHATSPLQWTLSEAHAQLLNGATTSSALTSAALQQQQSTKALNAYTTCTEELALAASAAADSRYKAGKSLGPLDGVPISIKDNFCTDGIQTTASSKTLAGFVAPYDASVVKRLKDAGAVIVGKTNMDEFGMGNATTNSFFGTTRNPWSHECKAEVTAGGSSGGAAASVASYSSFGGIGSDTGGSIRLPAAYCGIVGLKPTYGRVSRYGLIAYASSLDCPSVCARSVTDVAHILNVIEGADRFDSTSVASLPPTKVPTEQDAQSLKGLVVGLPREFQVKELSTEMQQTWQQGIDWLKQAGAKIVWVDLPLTKLALPTYYLIAPAEASSNLARYDGLRFGHCFTSNYSSLAKLYTDNRTAGFGVEVQRRVLLGSFALSSRAYSSFFQKAQQVRRMIADEYSSIFARGVHVLLTPTSATAAKTFDELKMQSGVDGYLDDIMTVPANLAGLPAISVPVGRVSASSFQWRSGSRGLPLGLQLIGRSFDESTLLRTAAALELRAKFESLPFHSQY